MYLQNFPLVTISSRAGFDGENEGEESVNVPHPKSPFREQLSHSFEKVKGIVILDSLKESLGLA